MVVGVDLTEYSEIVIEHALDQAARHQAPELHFLHVSERRKASTEDLNERLSSAVYPALQVFNQSAAQSGTDWRARLHVRRGKPEQQITILAQDILADLIVIGSFGMRRRSTPNRVLSTATSPTLVVRMPHELDVTQCAACSNVRDDSDGALWFCDDHVVEHASVSPVSVWSNGNGTLMP